MCYKYMFIFSINSSYSNKDIYLFQLEYFYILPRINKYSTWNISISFLRYKVGTG